MWTWSRADASSQAAVAVRSVLTRTSAAAQHLQQLDTHRRARVSIAAGQCVCVNMSSEQREYRNSVMCHAHMAELMYAPGHFQLCLCEVQTRTDVGHEGPPVSVKAQHVAAGPAG